MKKTILTLSLCALFSPSLSHAATFQLQLGQNAQLQSGDAAIIQRGGLSSAITCGGSAQPPSFTDFPMQEVVNLANDYQGREEYNARALCETTLDPGAEVNTKLLNDAKNDCLRQYDNCAQLGTTERQLVPKERNQGKWGCFIKVIVRGRL